MTVRALVYVISMGISSHALADRELPKPDRTPAELRRVANGGPPVTSGAANEACVTGADILRDGFENAASPTTSIALWSDPATWNGLTPVAGSDVQIPANKTVILDISTPVLRNLDIQGRLLASSSVSVGLQARRIRVSGAGSALIIGCEAAPYTRTASIVLHGQNLTPAQIASGDKGILVDSGGLLSLIAPSKRAWTKLSANVAAGTQNINVLDMPTGWQIGEEIIVAPSSHDAREYDLRTISAISGQQITLSQPLSYAHWGTLQTYAGKTLDQRAAVANLRRSIQITGAAPAAGEKIGAHIMVMGGGQAKIDGVEIRGGGQAGHPGRYPFHWHFAGAIDGQYIRNSVIRDSFQRAIVVHQSHGALVERNITFNVSNHAFVWAEDGNETRNRFLYNVGLMTTSPEQADFAFPSDSVVGGFSEQAEGRSGTFWGRNFANVLIGNIAAGSIDGMGFFFDRFSGGLGNDEGRGLVFQDNIAHSHYRPGNSGVAGEIYPEATFGHGLMVTTNIGVEEHRFERYTGYKNYGGAWLEDRRTTLKDSVLADNGAGAIMLRGVLEHSVIVGASANTIGGSAPRVGGFGLGLSGGVHLPSSHGGTRAPIVRNTSFINQRDAAFTFDVDSVGDSTTVQNISYVNTPERFAYQEGIPFEYGFGSPTISDYQGQLYDGSTPVRWFKRRSQDVSDSCVVVSGAARANAYACPTADSLLLRYFNAPSRWTPLVRDDGATQVMEQPWYFDQALEQPNVATLMSGRRYDVLWETDPNRRDKRLEFDDAAGKSVELSWPVASGSISVLQDGQAMRMASSTADLQSSVSSAWFLDSTRNRLRVKFVGQQMRHVVALNANFAVGIQSYQRPSVNGSNLIAGVQLQIHPAAAQSLRNRAPSTVAQTTQSLPVTSLSRSSIASFLPAQSGIAVIRGYLNAPTAGVYRMSVPAAGGSVDLYLGEHWLTGSMDNRFPVVHEPGNTPDWEANQIALAAGWHPFTIVFSRIGDQANFTRALWLRWVRPGSTNSEAIPVFRAP
jgi:hypothetical protein